MDSGNSQKLFTNKQNKNETDTCYTTGSHPIIRGGQTERITDRFL